MTRLTKILTALALLLVLLGVQLCAGQDTSAVYENSYVTTRHVVEQLVCPDTTFSFDEYRAATEREIVSPHDSIRHQRWTKMNQCVELHASWGHDVRDTLYTPPPDTAHDDTTGGLVVEVTTLYPYEDSTRVLQDCMSDDNVLSIRAERGRVYATDSTTWNPELDFTALDGWRIDALPQGMDNIYDPNEGGTFFDVPVDFCQTGTHYVWMRVQHSGGRGADNSVHISADGASWNTYNDLANGGDMADTDSTEWTWVSRGTSSFGRTLDARMTLEIDSTGPRNLMFKRREAGLRIDHIYITTDATWTP